MIIAFQFYYRYSGVLLTIAVLYAFVTFNSIIDIQLFIQNVVCFTFEFPFQFYYRYSRVLLTLVRTVLPNLSFQFYYRYSYSMTIYTEKTIKTFNSIIDIQHWLRRVLTSSFCLSFQFYYRYSTIQSLESSRGRLRLSILL